MKNHSSQFLKIVDDARSRIKETNVEEVRERQERGDQFILVDVREESEWAKGRLPGSIHMGKGIIERDIESEITDTGAEIILYCGGGYRSALSADNIQKMGYSNASSMDGGYGGWVNAGYPVVMK